MRRSGVGNERPVGNSAQRRNAVIKRLGNKFFISLFCVRDSVQPITVKAELLYFNFVSITLK